MTRIIMPGPPAGSAAWQAASLRVSLAGSAGLHTQAPPGPAAENVAGQVQWARKPERIVHRIMRPGPAGGGPRLRVGVRGVRLGVQARPGGAPKLAGGEEARKSQSRRRDLFGRCAL